MPWISSDNLFVWLINCTLNVCNKSRKYISVAEKLHSVKHWITRAAETAPSLTVGVIGKIECDKRTRSAPQPIITLFLNVLNYEIFRSRKMIAMHDGAMIEQHRGNAGKMFFSSTSYILCSCLTLRRGKRWNRSVRLEIAVLNGRLKLTKENRSDRNSIWLRAKHFYL